jgi:hypothetical protein
MKVFIVIPLLAKHSGSMVLQVDTVSQELVAPPSRLTLGLMVFTIRLPITAIVTAL